jgi:hypothetical protein
MHGEVGQISIKLLEKLKSFVYCKKIFLVQYHNKVIGRRINSEKGLSENP